MSPDINLIVILIALLLLARVQGGALGWVYVIVTAIQLAFGQRIIGYIVSYYYAVQSEEVKLLQQQCGKDAGCINAAAFTQMGFGPGIEPTVFNIMFLCNTLLFLALCISIYRRHRKRTIGGS